MKKTKKKKSSKGSKKKDTSKPSGTMGGSGRKRGHGSILKTTNMDYQLNYYFF